MLSSAQKQSKKDGINQFLKAFPWWYSLVKWLVPIAVGATSALLIGAVTTGMLGLPTFLSGLGALPVLYANISAFGAFSLLGISMITVATIMGGAAGLMTRIGLFPLVETMAHENFKAVEIFQGLTMKEQRKTLAANLEAQKTRLSEIRAEFDGALVELNSENEKLKQEIMRLKNPGSTVPVLLSDAANSSGRAQGRIYSSASSSSEDDGVVLLPDEQRRKQLKHS